MSDDDKKKSTLDSIVMGAIIGTAIGSAIGMSVAPKKGSETREMIKEKTRVNVNLFLCPTTTRKNPPSTAL